MVSQKRPTFGLL